MQILYALERIRTPLLDDVMGALTYLGDEALFIAIAICIYWCIDKKWGCYVMVVCFSGALINQFLKIVCRVPRPWVRDPAFTIVERARAAATGYSFPSGHTANVSGTLGCWARFTKRKWLRVLCLVLIALVSFSRMYLGVHYPADVAFSLGVSAVLVLALYPLFRGVDETAGRIRFAFLALTLLGLGFALWTTLRAWGADVDAANLYAAQKAGWLLVGCGAAMLLGTAIERRYIRFCVEAPLWAQILKIGLGVVLILGIRIGLKSVLPDALWCHALRYFCMVLFAACVWPLTFPWFARGCKRSRP